jgi:hypothetical protein
VASAFFGDRFGGKDYGLQTYKLYILPMQGKDRLVIRMANKIFKVYIKNFKTYVVDDL